VVKAVESFKGSQRATIILEKLVDYPNVPRKKTKFFNFMRNSFRSYGINDFQLNEIWSVIDSFEKTNNSIIPDHQSIDANIKRHAIIDEKNNEISNKKLKSSDAMLECEKEINLDNEFDWFLLIKNECQKNEKNLIKKQKLQKKVKMIFYEFMYILIMFVLNFNIKNCQVIQKIQKIICFKIFRSRRAIAKKIH
jgi:hypothetical protein